MYFVLGVCCCFVVVRGFRLSKYREVVDDFVVEGTKKRGRKGKGKREILKREFWQRADGGNVGGIYKGCLDYRVIFYVSLLLFIYLRSIYYLLTSLAETCLFEKEREGKTAPNFLL